MTLNSEKASSPKESSSVVTSTEERGKILLVFSANRTEAENNQFCMIVEALLLEGFAVSYISPETLDIEERANLKPALFTLPVRNTQSFFYRILYNLLTPFYLLREVLNNGYKYVVVFRENDCILGKFAVLFSNTILDFYLTSLPWKSISRSRYTRLTLKLRDAITWLSFAMSSRIVVQTHSAKAEIVKKFDHFKEKVKVLPSAVIFPIEVTAAKNDTERSKLLEEWKQHFFERKDELLERLNIPHKSVLIVAKGEESYSSGHETSILETVVRARADVASERLYLAIHGDEARMPGLNSIVMGLGLSPYVRFLGDKISTIEVVACCDLFISAVGDGRVSQEVLEALGHARPVFVPDTPEAREVISEEALLYNPFHVGKLADRLRELISGRAGVERLTKFANQRVSVLSFAWSKSLISLYRK